jgi:DNA-binding response OmpR family regulator
VRWGNFRPTDPPEPEQVKKEGFFYAGFRCRDLVRTNPALNGVPILFYSLLEDIDVAHLLKPGDTFLSKSFRGEELVEVVEKLLNQKKAAAAAA